MSRRFTRNIKDTDFKKEPLYTNQQNDLLSDGTDVAVRNNDEYHLLTDNIKTITSANTGLLRVQSTGKNSRKLVPNDKILTKDDPELDKFAKKSDLDGYAKSSELENYAPKSELDNYVKETSLNIEDYPPIFNLKNYRAKGIDGITPYNHFRLECNRPFFTYNILKYYQLPVSFENGSHAFTSEEDVQNLSELVFYNQFHKSEETETNNNLKELFVITNDRLDIHKNYIEFTLDDSELTKLKNSQHIFINFVVAHVPFNLVTI